MKNFKDNQIRYVYYEVSSSLWYDNNDKKEFEKYEDALNYALRSTYFPPYTLSKITKYSDESGILHDDYEFLLVVPTKSNPENTVFKVDISYDNRECESYHLRDEEEVKHLIATRNDPHMTSFTAEKIYCRYIVNHDKPTLLSTGALYYQKEFLSANEDKRLGNR